MSTGNTKEVQVAVREMVWFDIATLVPFQGDLKTLTEERYEELKKEIIERKFSFAFHAWANAPDGKKYVSDGHQRLRVLTRMRIEGWRVPEIPVVLMEAVDEFEFRRKVLSAVAQYGEVSDQGLYEFAELGGLPPDVLAEYPLPNFDMDRFHAEYYEDTVGSDSGGEKKESPKLADRFLVPPFSVLDARQGYWQDRKQQWLALGIKSELGRNRMTFDGPSIGDVLTKVGREPANRTLGAVAANVETTIPDYYIQKRSGKTHEEIVDAHERKKASRITPGGGGRAETTAYVPFGRRQHMTSKSPTNHVDGVLMKSDSGNDPQYYFKKQEAEKRLGRELSTEEFQRDHYQGPDSYESGTSIFDPVLCELAYRWFCPKGGSVLDPFAGGSVRGIIAAHCGLHYHGVELRAEQVEANKQQLHLAAGRPTPIWTQGDSAAVLPTYAAENTDLVFACPPYADLEQYSEDPADLSNMPWEQFLATYRNIIQSCVRSMKPDRFAVWVIGDVRDRETAAMRNLVGETVRAFIDAGAPLYNEAILVTMLGSLPVRAGRAFTGTRVLGKTHQNVLVFLKGDRRRATEACGEVDIPELQTAIEESDPSAPQEIVLGGEI